MRGMGKPEVPPKVGRPARRWWEPEAVPVEDAQDPSSAPGAWGAGARAPGSGWRSGMEGSRCEPAPGARTELSPACLDPRVAAREEGEENASL